MGTWWISDAGLLFTADEIACVCFPFCCGLSFSEGRRCDRAAPWLLAGPTDSCLIDCPLWLWTKPTWAVQEKTKASEGFLLQSPKPGKGRKGFLPKLTKTKLSKKMKRAEFSRHHGCLGSEALKKSMQVPQGSPRPCTQLKAIATISGHRADDQGIEDHHSITPRQQF